MAGIKRGKMANSPQVQSWRLYTKHEMLKFVGSIKEKTEPTHKRRSRRKRPDLLVIRDRISTLDMYCYLKARFGEPNGFQTFLASDDSDNWIHWDYNIKAGDADIHISGMSRETHVLTSENLSDEQWRDLILNIKADFARVGKEKSNILRSLEKWAVFRNKYMDIADLCSHKHETITDFISSKPIYSCMVVKNSKKKVEAWARKTSEDNKRRSDMANSCLELSLLTPVMAEAFLNMIILTLCKPEVRDNKRLFDSLLRSQIDVKVADLQYKCWGFVKAIQTTHPAFVNFKRVMDKRNHAIHGNIDPEREKVEIVYFDRKRPLFSETGDHVRKFVESIEAQAEPETVVKDYEDIQEFLSYTVTCLEKDLQKGFWRIMEDHYPGFDIHRKKVGALFPGHVITGRHEMIRYDSDLAVSW